MRQRLVVACPGLFLVLLLAGMVPGLRAEDADRPRPYIRFHSGDIEPLWGVDDHWSFGVGMNFNRYLGAELALDYYLKDWPDPVDVAEVSSYHLVPELRLRYPMMNDRLVPYVIGGIGPAWLQSKDVHDWVGNTNVHVQGFTYTVAMGAGLEYFIADNVTFGIEAKYNWVQPIDGQIGTQTESADLSAFLFTFGLRIYLDENRPRPLVSMELDPASRFYFGVRLGGNWSSSDSWGSGGQLQPEQAAWGGQVSQTGGLLFGADFGEHLGAEISFDHVNRVVHSDTLGEVAEYGMGWALLNARLRFPHGRWVPYGTIGVGGCFGEYKDFKPASSGISFSGGGFHPAVGAGAGIEYFIVRNFSFCTDFRYGYSWGQDFGIKGAAPAQTGDISYFAATIGFRVYLFDF